MSDLVDSFLPPAGSHEESVFLSKQEYHWRAVVVRLRELEQQIKPKCPDCNSVGMSHCSDPEHCGGIYWPDHMYRKLEQQIARLSAPVSDEEMRQCALHWMKLGTLNQMCDMPVLTKSQVQRLIAARTAPAQESVMQETLRASARFPKCECGGVAVSNASGDITRTCIRCGMIVKPITTPVEEEAPDTKEI